MNFWEECSILEANFNVFSEYDARIGFLSAAFLGWNFNVFPKYGARIQFSRNLKFSSHLPSKMQYNNDHITRWRKKIKNMPQGNFREVNKTAEIAWPSPSYKNFPSF